MSFSRLAIVLSSQRFRPVSYDHTRLIAREEQELRAVEVGGFDSATLRSSPLE